MGQSNSSFLGNINREFEEREAEKRAQSLGFGYVNVAKFPPNPDVLKLVSVEDARKAKLFPLVQNGKILRVALVSPDRAETQELLEKLNASGYEIEKFLCSEFGFLEGMKGYDSEFLKKKTVQKKVQFDESNSNNLASKIKNLAELEEKVKSMPAEVAMSEIELAGLDANASDIHLQPEEGKIVLRFRVDGVLHDVFSLQPETAHKLVTRIKYESGMRSNVSNIPQDGHASFTANGRKIDLRVSTLPTPFGESVVLRLLDSMKGIQGFGELGFSEVSQDKIISALQAKTGLILVTGPTGSGKTTTLYSMLSDLNQPEKKLVTLEDPIEYELEGVSQSQVDEEKEYNFDTGLSALLRHDPDVILVGEIRTQKTAKMASEASLTGHIVLSSLHTNSAVGAISRLRNLGLENFNIAPTITAIFAQRLVRRVCPYCMEEMPIPNDSRLLSAVERIKEVQPNFVFPETIKKSVGCEKCSHTGYEGRMAICEAFLMDDEIRKMILEGQSEIDILKYLKKNKNFLTLFEDGMLKVLQGETTLEELFRVAS